MCPAVVSLAGKLRDVAWGSAQARRAILPLRAAAAALAPSADYLTPIHAMLLQWCAVAHCHCSSRHTTSSWW